jgi:hypothetical protein
MEPLLLESTDEILSRLSEDAEATANGYPITRCADSLVVRDAINESAMTADFVIVTRSKDINRNGHRVLISADEEAGGQGLVLSNFERNPVVLWNHGFGGVPFPIARSGAVRLLKTKAEATAQFSQSLPEASQIFALIAEGILNTTSISFLPLKARLMKLEQEKLQEDEYNFRGQYAFDFLTNDLLEWSVVDIPADAGAVRKCLERGSIKGEKITQCIRQSLVKMAGDKPVLGVGVDLAALQQKHDALAGENAMLVQAVGHMGDLLNAQQAVRQAAADKANEQKRLDAITQSVAGEVRRQLGSALDTVAQSVKALQDEVNMLTGKW